MQSSTKRKILILICGILIMIIGALFYRIVNKPINIEYTDHTVYSWSNYSDITLRKYAELVKNKAYYQTDIISNEIELNKFLKEINLEESMDHDFNNYNYTFIIFHVTTGNVEINNTINSISKTIEFTVDTYNGSNDCLIPSDLGNYYKIFELQLPKNIDNINVSIKKNYTSCYNGGYGLEEKKPIIYIYPTEEIDLTVKLGNPNLITHSYPKYDNEWNIHVDTNGNIYDYKTDRNYYALYWEGKDNTPLNMNEGFVVKGEDTTKFLEEKLEILGLNEKEINEFIMYWLPRIENNKYTFVRFRTIDEINNYMSLEFSKEPDTIIRVMVDFKPLDKNINVKEQQLEKVKREGFTIVEWGARLN